MSEQEKELSQQKSEESQAGMDTFFAERPVSTEEQPSKKGMSKNIKMLIASISALAVLGGTLTAVLLVSKVTEDNTPIDESALMDELLDDDEKNAVMLNPQKAEDLKEIKISNTDNFRVYPLSEKKDETDSGYTIEGYEDIPLDTGYISTLVNNASELSAEQLVEENPSDLSKYGLDNPVSKVTMCYQDGTEFQFFVGNASPMDSAKTYCMTEGNVYLIRTSLMNSYEKGIDYFLSKTILEKPSDDNYPIVNSLRIERENLNYDLYMEYAYDVAEDTSVGGTAATHIMKEPVTAYLNVEKSADVTNGMFGLTAEEIVKVHPSESDLKTAGIDQPSCIVTMSCDDGNTYVLKFGKNYTATSGTASCYAYLEGTDILYGVAETRAVWTTLEARDITAANVFATNVWNIATLDITAGTKELHFSGEGTDKENYVVTKNGEACDTERFRLLYKFLLYIYGEELYLEAELPASAPDAEVHLTSQNGREDYTISFYKMSGLNAMIAVNGVPTYKIRSSCIDTLLHNVEIFDDVNQEFIMTWQ